MEKTANIFILSFLEGRKIGPNIVVLTPGSTLGNYRDQ